VHIAESAPAFQSMVDPDHVSFANPVCMTKAIVDYCVSTGQKTPESHAEFVRCIFESLSLKYKYVLEKMISLAPFPIEKLHVIGGGSKTHYLTNGLPMLSECLLWQGLRKQQLSGIS